ncbi:plasma membrane localization protein [Neocucurbitaria cava]|uniref:Plasma membrane localization protein n=1 Tax=Neocucurbitaria cava TaxID=798079 RepID=A0A9W8Y7R5_9PLEO|nr:plasma membrane localization protein [Neocucurbitaria cava]
MHAARQACRPKHQVLVLKCYPKFQKNNADVKANSSELSYLLYYASTRRSKLQKVGDFLDKRATKDVWKGSTGSVQVTLQIVRALIEKCPRDLPLYAGAVLRILRTILHSNDVTMVEESVPTFEALCAHQDPAALAADQNYIRQYEEIVQLYAQFASKDAVKTSKTPISVPVAIRYRKAGLQALKAVASSESLGSETGRQLAAIIPAILLSIHSDSGAYVKRLVIRESEKDEHEKELALRRRHSVSTARTTEEDDGGDPLAASGTTEDADKLAEEEVGVLALQALRNIFQGVNRGQLRLATSAVLKFVGTHVRGPQHPGGHDSGDWATVLMAMICQWAPVQDRYAILVGAVEALVRSPIMEDDLERQLVLATIIDHLLASTINFIGLSVMDVLVGLISHTLLLLQLGGPGSNIMPHHQQTTSVLSEKDLGDQSASNKLAGVVMEIVKEPSNARVRLLETVQKCMADLATHVYYTDQISDMVGAILSRLKPSRLSSISTTAEAIENPAGAIDAVADSVSMQEKTYVDRFFSFETARITALESVKAIIKTANTRRPDGSSASVSRSKVGVSVWEGTQWLLRDPSGKVRKAYVDALVTWLNSEKKKQDLKIVDNYRRKERESDKGGLARRAVSNASPREKSSKSGKNSTFLPLLHLAVYENAIYYVDSEADYLLLHLLLTTLVNRLGVNAARSGLPMIMRLQEDIATIGEPGSKVRMGSLVHGFLWALSIALDFEVSSVGRALHNEISRRNNKSLWVKSIRVPPMPIERIETPHPVPVSIPAETVQSEALHPFDNREALVDKIAEGYSTSLYSPPSSPPGSPGRSMSMSSSLPVIHQPKPPKPAPELPYKVREELLADWTRDVCLAANTKDSSSASMTGSRSGTQYTGTQKNNYLGVNIPNGTLDSGSNSPVPSPRRAQSRPPSTAYGLVGRLASSPHRNHSPSATPGSTSSRRSTVRVDDLRRALSTSGGGAAPRTSYSLRAPSHHRRDRKFSDDNDDRESSASDSLVSVHSLSDASFLTADRAVNPRFSQQPQDGGGPDSPTTPAATLTPRPQTANSMNMNMNMGMGSPPSPTHAQAARESAAYNTMHDVPPVPPIPENLRASPTLAGTCNFADYQSHHHQSDTRDFAMRPKTAPNGGIGAGGSTTGVGDLRMKKSRSVKSGVSRGRGRSGERSARDTNTDILFASLPPVPNLPIISESVLWKNHSDFEKPLLSQQPNIRSNPGTAIAAKDRVLHWKKAFSAHRARVGTDSSTSIASVSNLSGQDEDIEKWIQDNLPSRQRPQERVLSITSLSSTSSCEMYTNTDMSDDEQEPEHENMQAAQPKSTLKIIELIMRKVELKLRDVACRECTGNSTSNSRSGASSISYQGNRKSSQSSGNKRKTRTEGSPPPDDDDDYGPNKRRRGSAATTADSSDSGVRFACPFYKHDPDKYRNRRTCPGPGWPTVHRMKEHLYRSHAQPIFCPICYVTCKSDKELLNHSTTAIHQANHRDAFVENFFAEFKKSFLSLLDRYPVPLSSSSFSR